MSDDLTVPVGDAEAARLLSGAAQVIAGLMTLGLVEHAQGPAGLLFTLFPTAQGDDRDRALFTAGAVTGAAVALRRNRSGGWGTDDLREVEQALRDAGWTAMAHLADTAATALENDDEEVSPWDGSE